MGKWFKIYLFVFILFSPYHFLQAQKIKSLFIKKYDYKAFLKPPYKKFSFYKNITFLKLDNYWGAIDTTGKVIVPFKYDSVYVSKNNNIIEVRKNKKLGLYNLDGKLISKTKYTYYSFGGYPYSYNQANEPDEIIRYGSRGKRRTRGKITTDGKVLHKDTLLPLPICHPRKGEFAIMKTKKRWYIYRNDSLVKFKPDFDTLIIPRFEGKGDRLFYRVCCENKTFRWSKTKNRKKYHKLKHVTLFLYASNGFLIGGKNNLYGLVDSSGKVIGNYQFDKIEAFFAGYAKVKKDEKYGLLNSKGFLVGDVKYYDIVLHMHGGFRWYYDYMENGIANVKTTEGWGFLNSLGKEICPPIFDSVSPFHYKGIALLMKDGKWGIINKDGKEILPVEYNSITPLSNENESPLLLMKNGQWGAIDIAGKIIVPVSYDSITPFYKNGLALVMNKGKWGVFDNTGKIIVPVSFDSITPFYENSLALVMNKDKWGIIDEKGLEVLPPIYAEVKFIKCFNRHNSTYDKFLFKVKKGNEYTMIDRNGKEVKIERNDYNCYD